MNESTRLISTFTPSLMPLETLEALFVKRQPVLDRLVAHSRISVDTDAKHFDLLVGPRGIGKTHLVALAYHKIKQSLLNADRYAVVWLREEEWGIASFFDLLLRILKTVEREGLALDPATLDKRIDALSDLPLTKRESQARALIDQALGAKVLLILAENLDMIFEGLGENGQKKLRAWLQEGQRIGIIASAPTLFAAVQLQRSPFYGFFQIEHLDEFTIDDASELLQKAARLRGRDDAAEFLVTPIGRARLRALQHLAGGNPRVYMIFAQFLTRQSMDDLVEPFMKTLDDLTPYYQAKMQVLSPQQRKIIEVMCDLQGGVTVKDVARHAHATSQSISSQMGKLREVRLVKSESAGKEAYYRLSEPLMRLCLNVKMQRRAPVRCMVEFLRVWYFEHELRTFAASEASDALERQLAQEALLSIVSSTLDPKIAALMEEFSSTETMNFDGLIGYADSFREAFGGWIKPARHLLVTAIVFVPSEENKASAVEKILNRFNSWSNSSAEETLDEKYAHIPCSVIFDLCSPPTLPYAQALLPVVMQAFKESFLLSWTRLEVALAADEGSSCVKEIASLELALESSDETIDEVLNYRNGSHAVTLIMIAELWCPVHLRETLAARCFRWALEKNQVSNIAMAALMNFAFFRRNEEIKPADFCERWFGRSLSDSGYVIATRIAYAVLDSLNGMPSKKLMQLSDEERSVADSMLNAKVPSGKFSSQTLGEWRKVLLNVKASGATARA